MSFWGYKPYVSVAQRREKALKTAAKAKKKGEIYSPIEPYRGAIAKSFWGKAWCANLEQYSDYDNRLPRGRTYTRNGSVIDLQLSNGEVHARVMGSELYEVKVTVAAVSASQWKAICKDCASSVASLVELLQGKLSSAVMERICAPKTGLFPAPKELKFECSCPDWADMCKHVAAVLYGVGARLDAQPELLFTLRHVNAQDLVAHASTAQVARVGATPSQKIMADADLADVFGLDLDTAAVDVPPPAVKKPKAAAKKVAIKKVAAKKVAVTKVVVAQTRSNSPTLSELRAQLLLLEQEMVDKALAKTALVKKITAKKVALKKTVTKKVVAQKTSKARAAG
jgi:uncharacterized Zn finger protein